MMKSRVLEDLKMEIKGTPFQRINEAARTTGLSSFYLREGCKSGDVPHVKSGDTYYINIPALYRKLGVYENEEEKR